MAIDGAVDTLKIEIQTTGVAKAQKQLNSLVGTLKTFKRLNQTMTGVGETAKEAGEGAKDASQDIATAGETIEVTGEKAGRTSATVKKLGASFRSAGEDGEKSTGLFARLGASFKKTTSHIASFASALKRIAMYRFLRSVIKAITSAIGEGITNAYNYSRIMGGPFAQAMDNAKSASLTFKNSIGAALAPALQALIPIIVQVCKWLTALNNLIARTLAILFGQESYIAAVEATTTWGDSLKSAAGAAKELKRQLLGFDELNVLNAPSSGGGGGGGASTPDYGSMFETITLPEKGTPFDEWLKDFRLVFSDVVLDWSNINGEKLAEKIISGLFTVAGLLLGGVPGAVVGFLLSLFVNKYLFNRDGKLDSEEIAKMVVTGLLGITGAIAGGLIGGHAGAFIGFSLGVILSMFVGKTIFDGDGKLSKDEISSLIVAGLLGIGGGIIGFLVGGLPGALIGFSLGVVLSISLEGIFQKATGSKDPVKKFIYGLIGKEYTEDGVSVDVDVVPDVNINTTSMEQTLAGFPSLFSNSGTQAADAFASGYNKGSNKSYRRLSATNQKNWNNLSLDTVDILGNTDVEKAYGKIDTNLNKGMRIVKVGDRTRWMTESQYVTDILGATDVTTPLQLIDAKMQYEWTGIQENTNKSAGAVSKTVVDKLNGINVNVPMRKLETDLGNSFNGINTLTGNKMTQVGNTMMDKIRATDIVTPMESLKSKLATKFEEVKKNTAGTGTTISDNLSKAFNNAKTNMLSAMNTLSSKIKTPLNSISTSAAQTTNNVAEAVRQAIIDMNKFKFTVPNWVNGYGGRTFSFNANVPQATKYTPTLMAEGGIVDKGQLFIAREKGAELIGAYGHQTGVMNNEQIVDSVSEGVYRAVVEALGNQSTTVQIDGKTLFEIVTERNNSQVRRTGRSPLLV